jgi:uncharacterized membrane protein
MNLLPEPLHPAIIHFPIVLILLGAVATLAAAFWRRHHVPAFAALLLCLGAVGAWVAVESGESDGGLLETGTPQRETLVDEHETWAKRTLAISIIAAVAAAASVLAGRWSRISRALAVLAAVASVAAAYCVYETGHRGGTLVYHHAAGVEVAVSGSKDQNTPAVGAGQLGGLKEGQRKNDAE